MPPRQHGRPDVDREDRDHGPLLERLGGEVRARRKALSLTMRELALAADVSERFLALLESGRANVSVARLEDIARALGASAADLLAAGESAGKSSPPKGPLVAVLGLRGAGKTTIGGAAAVRLGAAFVELDALVAERAGMALGSIFEMHGNAYYRRLEREELDRLLAARTSGIVATGGSLVTDDATFAHLRASAVTVWLRASAEDHWSRVVAQGDARPMANRADAMKELRGILKARRALYEQAEHVIDTSALGLKRSIERLCKITREAGNGYVAAK